MESSVALVFVAERDGTGKVRLMLDIRRFEEQFLPLDTTELPTPGAWQWLRTAALI